MSSCFFHTFPHIWFIYIYLSHIPNLDVSKKWMLYFSEYRFDQETFSKLMMKTNSQDNFWHEGIIFGLYDNACSGSYRDIALEKPLLHYWKNMLFPNHTCGQKPHEKFRQFARNHVVRRKGSRFRIEKHIMHAWFVHLHSYACMHP